MTLIVGALCSDGIVVGADSGATFVAGNIGPPTAMQPTSKLNIIDGKVVMGVSGPIALGQLYLDRIETLWKGSQLRQNQTSVAGAQRYVQGAIWSDAQDAIRRSHLVFGQGAHDVVLTHSLIALPVGRSQIPTLFQCDFQGMPEAASSDLPFVSVGGGQGIADPFLAFLRRVFWFDTSPTVLDGIFVAMWTLQHAIQVSPGGLAGPVEIAVLDRRGARLLSHDELVDHQQHVETFEQDMKRYRVPVSEQTAPPTLQTPDRPAPRPEGASGETS